MYYSFCFCCCCKVAFLPVLLIVCFYVLFVLWIPGTHWRNEDRASKESEILFCNLCCIIKEHVSMTRITTLQFSKRHRVCMERKTGLMEREGQPDFLNVMQSHNTALIYEYFFLLSKLMVWTIPSESQFLA